MSLFADAEEWQLAVGAQTWAGLAWGEMGTPPALLLHGWLDNAGSFAPLARLLDGRRLWVPDLPGHGRSGHRPPGTWYHFVDYVSDVMALAQALGLEQFDLIGHSMGGAIATLVAAAYPERIRRLVLIEALGPLARPAASCTTDLRRAIDARLALPDKQLKLHPDRARARNARMQANGLSEAAADALIERALMPAPGGYIWRSDPRQTLPTPIRGTEEQYLAVLEAIRAPTLAIFADPATPYLSGSDAERRLLALRPERVVHLPGSHHLHLENAPPVAELLGAFLEPVAVSSVVSGGDDGSVQAA
jgi:pimeloyl-ACP methyl ester carboxylesterase